MSPRRTRILSGVQPSGKLHLGNYFGAIRQHIALQDQGECFFFIADYHALTTIHDRRQLAENVRSVALDYLALGLDPDRTAFFRQSDVPEVTELAWILSTVTGMGLLERAHSYKDKVARGITPSAGLFFYPVLMAADILIYRSNVVPVGQDQVQHIEMTRDMAGSFNQIYGRVFPLPEARLDAVVRFVDWVLDGNPNTVPGTDGRKMSKSYGNTIEIFAEGSALKNAVMRIVTDSTPVEAPKAPENDNLFALYSFFADEVERQHLAARYRAGGLGYGQVKKLLLAKIDTYFAPARARRKDLERHPSVVEAALRKGAEKARAEAVETMRLVREATGLR
jgi:tryptophanyl-tRNA synthetase